MSIGEAMNDTVSCVFMCTFDEILFVKKNLLHAHILAYMDTCAVYVYDVYACLTCINDCCVFKSWLIYNKIPIFSTLKRIGWAFEGYNGIFHDIVFLAIFT